MNTFNRELIRNEERLKKFLNDKKETLQFNIQHQNQLQEMCLVYLRKISDSLNNNVEYIDMFLKFLESLKKSLKLSSDNLDSLNSQLEILDELLKNIDNNSYKENASSLEDFYSNYQLIQSNIAKNTLQIDEFLNYALDFIELKFLSDDKNVENNFSDEVLEDFPENTLIISEQKDKIFLPYRLSELEQIKNSNPDKYSDYKEILEERYILPYKTFQNFSISRFKEAFKLMRNKEKKSIREAFDLGMELLFNSSLHPAIISACRNLDELDIYLDCLENNETDEFRCFKIVFDMAPTISNNP